MGEIMLLWTLGQPVAHRHNTFVRYVAHSLTLDTCWWRLSLFQSPSCMSTPDVTGAVVWDNGVVIAKFLEHAAESHHPLVTCGAVELDAGYDVVGWVSPISLVTNQPRADLRQNLSRGTIYTSKLRLVEASTVEIS